MRFFIAFILSSYLSLGGASEIKKLQIGLDWYINPNHAPLLLAIANDSFLREGLSVELITPTDTNLPVKLLAFHQLDVAISFEPQYHDAKQKGLPIAWLVTLVDHPLEAIAVNESGDIRTISDLKGKRVGYGGGSSTKARLEQVLTHEGMFLQDIELINVKMNETIGLLSGQLDAVAGVMRNVEPIELKAHGFNTRLFAYEDYGVPPYAELILIIHQDHQDQPWAQIFKQVIESSIRQLQQDPEGSWKIVRTHFHDALVQTEAMEKINHDIWQATVPLFLSPSPPPARAPFDQEA